MKLQVPRWHRVRFSLAQLLLLVALAAILVQVGILLWQPAGTPVYSTSAVAFSPDGKRLAASLFAFRSYDSSENVLGADGSQEFYLLDVPELRSARLLDRASQPGELINDWPARSGLAQSVAFSPNGKHLATKDITYRLSAWNLETGEKKLYVHDGEFTGGICWANDDMLAGGGFHSCYTMRLSNRQSDELSSHLFTHAIAFSPDASTYVTATQDGRIDLRNIHDRKFVHLLQGQWWPPGNIPVAMSRDGRFIAGEGIEAVDNVWKPKVIVWDATAGNKLRAWEVPVATLPVALAFSLDGQTLAAGGRGGALHLFNLTSDAERDFIMDASIASVAFSPDGKLLATGDSLGRVSLWDVNEKKIVRSISLAPEKILSNWQIVIVASVIWLVAWRYIGRKPKA